MEMNWEWVAGAVVAVGALGTAAFGLVEAFGKALVLGRVGLPFVGYGCVRVVIKLYAPALKFTYGDAYVYSRGADEAWADAFARAPVRVTMPGRRQGESICFGADGQSLFLTSEKLPAPLWELPRR